MPTTPNMGLVTPIEDSVAEAGTWDTILNALFDRIDIHDHTTGLGLPIPSAALEIDADVAWSSAGTNYAITSLLAVDFAPSSAASVAGYAGALFVNSDDANNLYFRTQAGANVRIINGGVLDAASVAGAIGGDYAGVGALVDYVDGTDSYRFRQETAAAVRQYAKMESADLVIREYLAAGGAVVPVEAVTIKSPAALAASYALTLPSALPAAMSLARISSAGVIDTSSNIDESPTFVANRSITLSGTGRYKHAEFSRTQPIVADLSSGVFSESLNATGAGDFSMAIGAASAVGYCKIDQIDSYFQVNSFTVTSALVSGAGNVTYDIVRTTAGSVPVSILTAPVVSAADNVVISNWLSGGASESITAGYTWFLKITLAAGVSKAFYNLQMKYQPVA